MPKITHTGFPLRRTSDGGATLAPHVGHLSDNLCAARGARLTELRQQVLGLVLARGGVVKAYQVLTDLQAARGPAAPPTVYRALDFLVEQGLLHRVDALNGYIACQHLECQHHGLLLVCETCNDVTEIDATDSLDQLSAAAARAGFQPRRQDVLLTGLCQSCRQPS